MKLHKSKLITRAINSYIALIDSKFLQPPKVADANHHRWCNALDELDILSDCNYTDGDLDVSVEDPLRMVSKASRTRKKIFVYRHVEYRSDWYFVGDARQIAKKIENLKKRLS